MKKIFLLFYIVILITGCENDDKKVDSEENVLNYNAHIIDKQSLISYSVNTLILNKTQLNFNLSVGDIILASPTEGIPTGVFSKILTISQNADQLVCTTQPSNLNEAFRQLNIDYKYNKDYTQNAQLRGINLLSFPSGYELTSGFKVEGNINLNLPDVEIKYSKFDGELLPNTFFIKVNVNTEGSNLKMEASFALNVPEKTLYTFNNLPIIEVPVVVGGVPLIIPFWQYIEVNSLPLNISGKMKFDIKPEFSATLGISYSNGTWSNLSDYTIGASANELLKEDFDANLDADIIFFNPVYKIGPLWDPTLYAFFGLPNKLEAKIQTETPNYSLKYKLGVEAGIHYQFLLGIEGEKSFDIPVYQTTLQEGDFGIKINFIESSGYSGYHSFISHNIDVIASSTYSADPPIWYQIVCTHMDASALLNIDSNGLSLGYPNSNVVVLELANIGSIKSIRITYGDVADNFADVSFCNLNYNTVNYPMTSNSNVETYEIGNNTVNRMVIYNFSDTTKQIKYIDITQ